MTPRERILAIRLMDLQQKQPEYAKKLGIQADLIWKEKKMEGKDV